MLAKKVTALLVSAALVLALLAGCGGGQQSVARTLLNLLDGKYTNVSVEMDSELEADLRQVLRENEADDLAAIRADLALTDAVPLIPFSAEKGDGREDLVRFVCQAAEKQMP